MDFPVRRRWVFIALLLIGTLLISWGAFWLSGVLHRSLTSETFTVEAVTWELERPSKDIRIDEFVNSSYNTNVISANLVVHFIYYHEGFPCYCWNSFDRFGSRVSVNVSVSQGFVDSLFVNLTAVEGGILNVQRFALPDTHGLRGENLGSMEMDNLEISRIVEDEFSFGGDFAVEAESIDQPRDVCLAFPFLWMFMNQTNTAPQLSVTLGTTIFNGTAYQRIEMPIQMSAHAMISIVTIS